MILCICALHNIIIVDIQLDLTTHACFYGQDKLYYLQSSYGPAYCVKYLVVPFCTPHELVMWYRRKHSCMNTEMWV